MDGFFEGKIVRIDNVEISLDNELREFLGQDCVRAGLGLVERVLAEESSEGRKQFLIAPF